MDGNSTYKVTLIEDDDWSKFSFEDQTEAFDHAKTLISNADGPCSVGIERIQC